MDECVADGGFHTIGNGRGLGAARGLEVLRFFGCGRAAGYEYGLLLTGLTRLGSPLADPVAQVVLSARDGEGVWAEFYEPNGAPSGMRDRVWESGVNLAALIEYGRAGA